MLEEDEGIQKCLLDIPKLEVPSIRPTVSQVSYTFDEPVFNGQLFKDLPNFRPNPCPEFKDFVSWRTNPSTSPTPQKHYSTAAQRAPPTQSSQHLNNSCSNNNALLSELSSIKLEIMALVRRENAELLSQIRQEMKSLQKPEEIDVIPMCDAATQTQKNDCNKATNTNTMDKRSCGVQVSVKTNEQIAQTDDCYMVNVAECPNNVYAQAERDCGDYPENNGETFYRTAAEQLDMMIHRAVETAEREEVVGELSADRIRCFERVRDGRRPLPVVFQQFSPRDGPQPSEVSLGADALLQKYLPPEQIAECRSRPRHVDRTPAKGFAVLNMTNVSFAMGYEQERDRQFLGDNFDYHNGQGHSPVHYRHPEMNQNYREYNQPQNLEYDNDFRGFQPVVQCNRGYRNHVVRQREVDHQFEPIAPHRRGYEEEAWEVERRKDRVLDLTAIRRQPKLL